MEFDNKIVKAKIHPGIGIARVGNSKDEYYLGPEVPYPVPTQPNYYKDSSGALKRQAARFRLFGYNQAGVAIKELNADNAEITWTVHVANKKAAWYNFDVALDIPEAQPSAQRNANFVGEERKKLVIDPGPRSIEGKKNGEAVKFDSGEFLGQRVYLGEVRTDERGNLVFLGGHGISDTTFPNNTAYTFANNDGWYDDISDGPVYAQLKIDGENIPVDPAWVVVGPPDYAPDIISIQTMYDVLYDTYQKSWIQPINKPSFTQHIYPILYQFCNTQWVNYGFHVQFGWGSPQDFMRPGYFERLWRIIGLEGESTTSPYMKDLYQETRLQIFNIFRSPSSTTLEVAQWPQMYGDAMTVPLSGPRSMLALTKTQYNILQNWAAGNFIPDWDSEAQIWRSIDEVKVEDRPHTLDKAALWFCLGGPFHPGCEMTWPMRHPTMYYEPFRIRPRADNQPEPEYGQILNPASVMSANGPLYANGPGDITRWMAVPWQTDTASCRAGYDPGYDPFLPTFWPAHVPNHVLSRESYDKVIDQSLPLEDRLAAFNTRSTWYRFLNGGYLAQVNQMVSDFGKLGVVERIKWEDHDEYFPAVMYVESQVGFKEAAPHHRNTIVGKVDKALSLRRLQS
jgi:hypothetical protein